MKRVAFFLQSNPIAWLGGLNYFRNLLTAVCSNDDRCIEPVLFIHPRVEQEAIKGFPLIEIIRTPLVSPRHPVRLAGRLSHRLLNVDLSLESLLTKHSIDILSHSGIVGKKSRVASISWIPDFQHRRMPQYFASRELQVRNREFRKMIARSHRIIVSSYDAQRDFQAFALAALDKSRVLQFVSCIEPQSSCVSRDSLFLKYKIDRPYFHLPNQFWPHKNHAVVIDALSILAKRGIDALVLATGRTSDYRGPAYFESVMERARIRGVVQNFRVLGMVPSSDLYSLMIHSVALINPSNFEGWSTSVEESKTLGLPIVLSDIHVHLEQAPALGRFFKVDSAEDLANALIAELVHSDQGQTAKARQTALLDLPRRIQKFGRAFEQIAMEAHLDAQS